MTKKVAFAIAIAITASSLGARAQRIDDALRFSSSAPAGSARGLSVGGALGTLGGEYSSMFVNPAGIGFFKTSEAAFTLGFQNANNKGTYLGSSGSDSKGSVFINSAAFIFGGSKKNSASKWENFSIGIGFNRTNSYNERVYYKGVNDNNSLSFNYFMQADAAGITNPDEQLGGNNTIGWLAHSAVLAYQTYLIDTLMDGNQFNGQFFSSAEEIYERNGTLLQERFSTTKGSANEISVPFAGNYNDQLYIGGSLNVPVIRYERDLSWRETNNSVTDADFNYFEVTERLKTEGLGFNAKVGVIYKPITPLRLGLAFHSPSWITFTDTYSTDMVTSTKSQGILSASSTQTNEGFADESKYTITTPWKGIASATYIFNPSPDPRVTTGFITVDYEYMDYAAMKMRLKNGVSSDKEDTDIRNRDIDNTYQGASNIRIGGELKMNIFAIRAGYAHYGSPYKSKDFGDGARQYYTGGVGYRNKGIYLDLGIVYGTSKYLDQPYVTEPNQYGFNSPAAAEIKRNNTSVLLTLGFKM